MGKQKVTVQVPATTANLGPGFDCLGLALDLCNTVSISASSRFQIEITGEGAQELPRDGRNIAYRAIQALAEEAGRPLPPLSLALHNNIPLARGLGSSAAAIVGGLVAANLFFESPLPREALLELAYQLEGHPDNVVPALYGGCTVTVREGSRLVHTQVPLPPGLRAVLFIPDLSLATQEARSILPAQVSRSDAVFNVGRVALLTTALATGRLDLLRTATQDALHQPWRKALFPPMEEFFAAALEAGALCAFLSGAGPSVLALTLGKEDLVAHALRERALREQVRGRIHIASPRLEGAQVLEREQP
jgi:homoserine kinase